MLTRMARRVVAVLAEINYAQRKLDAIRMNADSYLTDANKAPQTYAEFRFRTSGMLLHEPPATRRAHGRLVG